VLGELTESLTMSESKSKTTSTRWMSTRNGGRSLAELISDSAQRKGSLYPREFARSPVRGGVDEEVVADRGSSTVPILLYPTCSHCIRRGVKCTPHKNLSQKSTSTRCNACFRGHLTCNLGALIEHDAIDQPVAPAPSGSRPENRVEVVISSTPTREHSQIPPSPRNKKSSQRTPRPRPRYDLGAAAAPRKPREKYALAGISRCYRELSHYYAELANVAEGRATVENV